MTILVDKNTRVVVQGITGKEGSGHALSMLKYGTKVVAGVTPGKAGRISGRSSSLQQHETGDFAHPEINASIIFVPAALQRRRCLRSRGFRIETCRRHHRACSSSRLAEIHQLCERKGSNDNRSKLSGSNFSRRMQNWNHAGAHFFQRQRRNCFKERNV